MNPGCMKESQRRGLCALHLGGRPRAKKHIAFQSVTHGDEKAAGVDQLAKDDRDLAAANILVAMSNRQRRSTSSSCSDLSSISESGSGSSTPGRPGVAEFEASAYSYGGIQTAAFLNAVSPAWLPFYAAATRGEFVCSAIPEIRATFQHEMAPVQGIGPQSHLYGLSPFSSILRYYQLLSNLRESSVQPRGIRE